jgi:hypothetical protein
MSYPREPILIADETVLDHIFDHIEQAMLKLEDPGDYKEIQQADHILWALNRVYQMINGQLIRLRHNGVRTPEQDVEHFQRVYKHMTRRPDWVNHIVESTRMYAPYSPSDEEKEAKIHVYLASLSREEAIRIMTEHLLNRTGVARTEMPGDAIRYGSTREQDGSITTITRIPNGPTITNNMSWKWPEAITIPPITTTTTTTTITTTVTTTDTITVTTPVRSRPTTTSTTTVSERTGIPPGAYTSAHPPGDYYLERIPKEPVKYQFVESKPEVTTEEEDEGDYIDMQTIPDPLYARYMTPIEPLPSIKSEQARVDAELAKAVAILAAKGEGTDYSDMPGLVTDSESDSEVYEEDYGYYK